MCIAIVKPAGKDIPAEYLNNCWATNKDGAGFAFIKKGKVNICKGFMTFEEFHNTWNIMQARYKASPFLLHFRIRSQGKVVPEQTHPFPIPNGAVIHNGTITGAGATYGGDKNDTQLFIEKFVGKLTKEIVSKHKDAIGNALDYNKLAFLYNDGSTVIINERSGWWHDGVWYSNQSYKRSGPWPKS